MHPLCEEPSNIAAFDDNIRTSVDQSLRELREKYALHSIYVEFKFHLPTVADFYVLRSRYLILNTNFISDDRCILSRQRKEIAL